MNVYIASDFHLKFVENAEDKKRREKVLSFLDSIKDDADLLILNGDIFDLWFVWKKFIIKGY
ncbi:MAG: UDP-2,3-diacylglucosamine diphosphatase, partial [Candidatus Cloacimonetes bacterium]|nr:UDP-2,3-diacylglucosamine diphosphatase [Candidatus Cloacimonadota bacterium]